MSDSNATELHETCGDDRFDLIAKARAKLLDNTNIESRPEEMAALDSILFRCWQIGWLDQLRGTPEQAVAATLGAPTLTAEQVSKTVYAHSIHADCADADWQAIADELNAMLGAPSIEEPDTIRNEFEDNGYSTLGTDDGSRWAELFGTPERAAVTLANMCMGENTCGTCPLLGAELNHCKSDYTDRASIAEWLRGKAAS